MRELTSGALDRHTHGWCRKSRTRGSSRCSACLQEGAHRARPRRTGASERGTGRRPPWTRRARARRYLARCRLRRYIASPSLTGRAVGLPPRTDGPWRSGAAAARLGHNAGEPSFSQRERAVAQRAAAARHLKHGAGGVDDVEIAAAQPERTLEEGDAVASSGLAAPPLRRRCRRRWRQARDAGGGEGAPHAPQRTAGGVSGAALAAE